jgi:hypothetical protein
MKSRLLGAVGACLFTLVTTIANAAPVNLLSNPGFETGDFSGWTISGTSIQELRIARSSEDHGTLDRQ